MDILINRFEDVHQHALSVRDWSQTYNQITPGSLQSTLTQCSNARFQVFREQINQRVVQHGAAPRGRVCFAVPMAVPGTARHQGREADDRSIFVLRGGEEFMFHMPKGMDMLSLTFDADVFEAAVANTAGLVELKTLMRQPVVQVAEHRLAESRARLIGLFDRALETSSATQVAEAERELERDLLEELLTLIADPGCDKGQRHTSSSGSYIVEKCHRMAVAEAVNPLSVEDLCQRLRVSRRTVQNSFRSVAQTTPVNYIRSIRLNGVRRELMSTVPSEMTIGDAAAHWGFFHLSHFSADYHGLFGELPSQTRRADGTCGSSASASRRTASAQRAAVH